MVENKYAGVAKLGIPMHLRYDKGKIICYDTLAEALADGVEGCSFFRIVPRHSRSTDSDRDVQGG
eukprot:4298430-Karenia_brevis.AAC.1